MLVPCYGNSASPQSSLRVPNGAAGGPPSDSQSVPYGHAGPRPSALWGFGLGASGGQGGFGPCRAVGRPTIGRTI